MLFLISHTSLKIQDLIIFLVYQYLSKKIKEFCIAIPIDNSPVKVKIASSSLQDTNTTLCII